MEELYESDVMWPDNHDRSIAVSTSSSSSSIRKQMHNLGSPPMDIPTVGRLPCKDDDGDEVVERGAELIPPHVLVSRRIAEKMAFSLCSGHGRTLKGRDLSHVRNSVLRMTGFIEGDACVSKLTLG